MKAFLRSAGVVVLGVIVALVVLISAEAINSKLFPMPAGMDTQDMDAMRAAIAAMPNSGFILVLLGWTIGTFAGAWLAARTAARRPAIHGGVVAAILLASGVMNMLMLPHPIWVWMAGLAGFVTGGYAGSLLGARRTIA